MGSEEGVGKGGGFDFDKLHTNHQYSPSSN